MLNDDTKAPLRPEAGALPFKKLAMERTGLGCPGRGPRALCAPAKDHAKGGAR